MLCFFFQAEDGIRDTSVTGVQTCALPISVRSRRAGIERGAPLASPASAVLPLDSISATVWVAQFPEVWLLTQIGRASCRERVYVSVGGVSEERSERMRST